MLSQLAPSLYAVVVTFSCVLCLGLAAYSWRLRHIPSAGPLALMMVAATIRNLGAGIAMLAPNPNLKAIGLTLILAITAVIATAWLLVAMEYESGRKAQPRRFYAWLCLEPLVLLALLLTNHRHHLIFMGVELFEKAGMLLPNVRQGPIFWGHTAYVFALILAGVVVLLRFLARGRLLHRAQGLFLIFAIATLLSAGMLTILVGIDLSPLAYILSGSALAICIFKFRFLDIMPIARNQVLEEMEEGILIVDGADRIVDFNRACERLLGPLGEGTVGQTLEKAIGSWFAQAVASKEQGRTEQTISDSEKVRHLEIRYSILEDARYQLMGRLFLLRDITEQRRADEERRQYTKTLEAAKTRLKQLNEMKSRFFANISHDFRTPLHLAIGPLEELIAGSYGPITPRARREMEMAKQNAQNLLRLTRQLLDLAKLDAGGLAVRPDRVDLDLFLRNLACQYSSLAARRKIELAYPINGGISIYFDPGLMVEVFSNLIDNAFKFTHSGDRIEVKTWVEDEGWVAVAVADTGKGISERVLPHIFDRFYRADESRLGGGSGIGLALAKELVSLHSGKVEVESERGKGTVFTVYLRRGRAHFPEVTPTLEGEDKAKTPTRDTQPAMDLVPEAGNELVGLENKAGQMSILVVEDCSALRGYIRRHLTQDFQLLEAVDGEEGLRMAREWTPELIVSDVMMPEMDGFQLCQALKNDQRTSHIPLILLTALADDEDKIRGLQYRADDYLTKPFNMTELHVRIQNLIQLRRQLRKRYLQMLVFPESQPLPAASMEAKFLRRLRKLMETNLADSNFKVATLAVEAGMSERQLQRKVSALTGTKPAALLRRIRLDRAAEFLSRRVMTVTEVAFEVGFNNPSHFAECFRKQFGKTPSAFFQEPK